MKMKAPRKVKYSGDKIVPQSDLRAGTSFRGSKIENSQSVKILQWNTGGLSQAKKLELGQILTDNTVDIFVLQESNLTHNQLQYYQFKDFTLHLLPKGRQISSGILVGVRTHLTSSFKIVKEMNNEDKIEIIKLTIWKNKTQLKIYSVYNPPNNTPNIEYITVDSNTIIIGDFNAHSKRWGYEKSNSAGKILEDLLNSTPLEVIYQKEDPPTYIHYSGTGTNPDILLVSSDLYNRTTKHVIEDPGSGHRAVIATIHLKNNIFTPVHSKSRWNFKKAKWNEYTAELESKFQKSLPSSAQSDHVNREFCKIVFTAAKKFIPRGKIKNYKPFWNSILKNMKNERDLARNKAEKSHDPIDVQNWRKLSAQFKKAVNSAKREHFSNFLEKMDYRKDGPKAYRFIHNIQNKKEHPKTPFTHNNKILTSDTEIANKFNNYYANIYKLSATIKKEQKIMREKIKEHIKSTTHIKNNVFNQDFTIKELNIAINNLKLKKSPGPDNIYPEFIKHLGIKGKLRLLSLYNLTWNTTIPADWKKAIIIPILKKNKPANTLSSYRPISLTSVIAKIMEKMISNRLNWFLESNKLLSHNQAGFRELHSTNEQILNLSQDIKDNLNKKEDTLAIFIDFQGAYDSVWRYKLLEKLQILGVEGNMLHWIKDFLIQRFTATKYSSTLSKYKQTHRGLPQGTVLSTTLFNVYVNDLPTHINKSPMKISLFADDVVMWISKPKNQSQQLINTAQQSLIDLQNWSSDNLMQINAQKTNFQLFSLRKIPLKISLHLAGTTINETCEAKYLGVTFDTKLTWKNHIEYIFRKAEKKLSLIKRLAGKKWGCSTQTLNTFYKMYIKPIITYCGEILITANVERLNRLQNQILRLITGAVKTTPITAMQILTNNPNISFEFEKAAITQYEKLIRLPCNTWEKRKPTVHLKTQQSFLTKVREIKQKLKLPISKESLLLKENPLHLIDIEHYTQLSTEVKKSDTLQNILKLLTLETINARYPTSEWLHIFTDGSCLPHQSGTGAGATCSLFSFYRGLDPNTTNFDGEISAILSSLQNLLYRINKFQKAVILSDSKAAILAITSDTTPKNHNVLECRKILKQLFKLNKRIALQWIPAHCGVNGNETADLLAKKGSKIIPKYSVPVSYHSIKNILKTKYNTIIKNYNAEKALGKRWEKLCDAPTLISELPRKSAVATFRLLTGHDCLNKHLYRFGISESSICPFCDLNEDMDQDHLLLCPSFIEFSSLPAKYWSARGRMTSLSTAQH